MWKYYLSKALFVALWIILLSGLTYLITFFLNRVVKPKKSLNKLSTYFVDIISVLYLFWDLYLVYFFIYLPNIDMLTFQILILVSIVAYSMVLSFYMFVKNKKIWVTFLVLLNGMVAMMIGTVWYLFF